MCNFYAEIRLKTEPIWQKIQNHPFVMGIGDGTLSKDRYDFFLRQDYLYLMSLSRFYALGAAKAPTLEDMTYFSSLLHTTLHVEMELHRRTCAAFGIVSDELENTQPAFVTESYTNLLLRTGYEGTFADGLAVHLPCTTGYVEIGKLLKTRGLPDHTFYHDWINTYSSREFEEYAMWLIERFNKAAIDASKRQRERWFILYQTSLRLEYYFFEMSWKKELWPEGLSEFSCL
ncbi:thiaminase II [candidate division KSB1 bacterium]|nr:thiaminase II [candidate division KSB1 bacterium]